MRRSIDFGTLTGSLSSTVKSSKSTGNSNDSNNGGTLNGTSHSASPSGSRFGTVAGLPSSELGSPSGDQHKRPRSTLSSAAGRAGRNGGGRRAFALGSLFNVGGSTHQDLDNIDGASAVTPLCESESAATVHQPPPLDAATGPTTPDTPAQRQHALMLAVQTAKAKDEAWEIVVQPASSGGLFFDYADNPSNKLEKAARPGAGMKKATPNAMFGGFSTRAKRFLGRTEDKRAAKAISLSATSEESVNANAETVADRSQAPASHMDPPDSETSPPVPSSNPSKPPTAPASPAKRPLEISEDDLSSIDAINKPALSKTTPASNSTNGLHHVGIQANQLLVLYVTTGSSSLTLYRSVGQLLKLDEELRKHYAVHMPLSPRPSVLSPPTADAAISPSAARGHTRRKSVLASLTRTFTSPALSRKGPPPTIQSSPSHASIAEEDSVSLNVSPSFSLDFSAGKPASSLVEHQSGDPTLRSPQHSMVQSQLSDLSDYLISLSSIAIIRTSKQWNALFKPGKEDHESARLEPLPTLQRTSLKGQRLKRMKSEGGLETRSPLSAPPDLASPIQRSVVGNTAGRKQVKIEDTGVDSDSIGHSSSRDEDHLRAGHLTESSITNSSAATSNSASMHMKREFSNGTTTSVSSAMSLSLEHAGEQKGLNTGVGDPEVLAYIERMRQESEARCGIVNNDTCETEAMISRQEGKSSKSTIVEYIPPTPAFPTSLLVQDADSTPTTTMPDPLSSNSIMPATNTSSEEPTLSTLEDSVAAAMPLHEAEEVAQLPPLSGATAVASDESAPQPAYLDLVEEEQQEQVEAEISKSETAIDGQKESSEGGAYLTDAKQQKLDSRMQRREKSSTVNTSVSQRTRGHRSSVGIEDFDILRVLGRGCAGKVLLARLRDATSMSTQRNDNSLYAIKAIHKSHVLAHRELAHTLTEQSILKKMATDTPNPFIVKMRWSFQDNDNLFLVLDFHSGGDLATQLSRWGRLGKDRTRFYAAEIIEGLESLHKAGIIYRDLKPENILLAADGHVVLTDFGLSKQFYRPSASGETGVEYSAMMPSWMKKDKTEGKSPPTSPVIADTAEVTTTFCGTAEYLAPEVLLGRAYSYPVDMWSLGTMIYEMLLGVTPFYNEDHGVMYRRVLHEQLDFGPSEYLEGDTRALLRGLLQKEPEFRMTTSRVKHAKYFEVIDWSFVTNKRYIPPFIPNHAPDDPADTQNFEECFLTMDLGFVDAKDTEEIESKAKTSGKEPDKAFDEDGRDVFADYSFDGAWADPENEEDADNSENNDNTGEEGGDRVDVEDTGEQSSYAERTASILDTQRHSEMPETSGTPRPTSEDIQLPEERADSSKDAEVHVITDTRPLLVLPESEALPVISQKKEDKYDSVEERLPNEASSASPDNLIMRNSVEMPRMASPSEMSETGLPRTSGEHEDWDVVEPLGNEQSAENGPKGPRKRLLAGTNLFAKGVVDKYKMQLKPLSRAPTPTRSYTARSPLKRLASGSVQQSRSAKTSNQLSPTPSLGGMSDPPSSVESSDQANRAEKRPSKGPARRPVTPRLLRASSEWMSNSRPTSPSPRFRMRRDKKGNFPDAVSPSSSVGQVPVTDAIGTVQAAADSSLDSNATLPIEEAGGFGLQPLTRQMSKERYLPSGVGESPQSNGAVLPADGQRRGQKLRKFTFDTRFVE